MNQEQAVEMSIMLLIKTLIELGLEVTSVTVDTPDAVYIALGGEDAS